MNQPISTPSWASPDWQAETSQWIRAVLAQHGRQLAGEITQPHLRPWSAVQLVPTDTGNLYFKAVTPALTHEIALAAALAEWLPEHTLQPLAIDTARAWMLLPDGGPRLRDRYRSDLNLAHWLGVLPAYARAQIALAERVPAMFGLGVPDNRLSGLAQSYTQLLANIDRFKFGTDAQLTDTERHALSDLIPQVVSWCAELAASPIPDSLHHGDLHDGNIFLSGDRPTFFDWGDASVTHPFMSMRTVYVSVEIALDLPEGGATDLPLADRYLEPWARFATLSDLRQAFQQAQRLAPIVSALAWHRSLAALPAGQPAKEADSIAHLLREFLQGATGQY